MSVVVAQRPLSLRSSYVSAQDSLPSYLYLVEYSIPYSTNFIMPTDKPEKIKVLMVCLG